MTEPLAVLTGHRRCGSAPGPHPGPSPKGSLLSEPVDLHSVLSQPIGSVENQLTQKRRWALTRQRRAAVAADAIRGIERGLVVVQDLADYVGCVLVVSAEQLAEFRVTLG